MPVDLAKKLAEGITSKLNFDYCCNRGHSFGETHVHGVVNEILSANIGSHVGRVHSGFPHNAIQAPNRGGRPREIDFAVEHLRSGKNTLYAEVKWAGSSHCTDQRVLLDLCRLQIVKSTEGDSECLFVLAGKSDNIDDLFSKNFLTKNTANLLFTPSAEGLNLQHTRRKREFDLLGNTIYPAQLQAFAAGLGTKLPTLPTRIISSIVNPDGFSLNRERFKTIVWRIESA